MNYEEAPKAVEALYDNRDYTVEEALENLQKLQEQIEIWIGGLRSDLDYT